MLEFPHKYRRQVERTMNRLPFVRWDRFIIWPLKKKYHTALFTRGVTITGWIDRADAYKDFITIDCYPDGAVDYMTSSAKHSLEIYKLLNKSNGRGHQNCKRVEHFFRPKNAIKLKPCA